MKNFKKLFKLIFFFFAFTFLFLPSVLAINMNSSRYKIQFGNVDIGSQDQTSNNYNLSTSVGQLAAGEFSSTGYIVKAGFQYLHSIIPFTFSISNIIINFGTLTPNTPATATTTLTVSFGGAGEYSVTASEQGPLQTLLSSAIIPDTSCDGGVDTCTESTSKPWTSNSKYGFGYSMSGNDIPADFIDNTYYRPFPDTVQSEPPVTIMSNINVGEDRQSTMTFKANISPNQSGGNYQTIISFVATPSY